MSKRGRPTVFYDGEYEGLKETYGHIVTTRRGILNKSYELRAWSAIAKMQKQGDSKTEYLVSPKEQKARYGILRELGKFPDDMIPALAISICDIANKEKRTIKELGNILRTYRLHPELFSETVSDNKEVECEELC